MSKCQTVIWFNINENLPEHNKTVLVKNEKGYSVAVFIDSAKMNEELREKGHDHDCVNVEKHPFFFCLQELKAMTVNNVSHWAALPEINDD